MNTLKLVLYIFIIMWVMIPIAAADFSDTFEDGTFNAWDSVGANWQIFDGSYDGTHYATTSNAGYTNLTKNNLPVMSYWEFDYRIGNGGGGSYYFRFESDNNYCRVQLTSSTIKTTGTGSCAGITDILHSIVQNSWYKVRVTDMGSTLNLRIYNATNMTMFAEYNIADPGNFGTSIKISTTTSYVRFDNIVASEIAPTVVSSVLWDRDTYIAGDVGTITYTISNNMWDFVSWYYVEVYYGEQKVKEFSASRTGTLYYYFPSASPGIYTVKLNRYVLNLISSTVAQDSAAVDPQGQSYIFVNSTIPVGKNFTIRFLYGFTPTPTDNLQIIRVERQTTTGYYYEKAIDTSVATTANTQYTVNGTVDHGGEYLFELFYGGKGVLATAKATASQVIVPPTMSISKSAINISRTYYSFGEILEGNYIVDSVNYSTYTIYYDIYNIDRDSTTTAVTLPNQVGNINMEITNSFYDSGDCSISLLGCQAGSTFYIAGSNKIRLMARNITTVFELDNKTFVLSMTNLGGYGISLSSNKGCVGEKVFAKVITPNTDAWLNVSRGLFIIKSMHLNGSSSVPFVFTTAGTYTFELSGSNGYIQQINEYTADSCDTSGAPPSGIVPGIIPFAPGENANDVGWMIKSAISGYIGNGSSSKFMVGLTIAMILAAIAWFITRHPFGGIAGFVLGTGLATELSLIDQVWAVVIITAVGLSAAGLARKV